MMRPYGGPHGPQVLNGALNYAADQWFADQGFVVIIADNRGTGGRGPAWDHSIYQNFVEAVIEDQVAAVAAVAAHFPHDVDVNRVGVTGWSFGGYLSALAVLERPDVFHAAVAGAPVTEWLWYDTAYTERYLGHPEKFPEIYTDHSLISKANQLDRPLMLVHGLADDNVVAAHSLAFSGALLANKKPHTVLPLSGVTHMTPQEIISENLMLLTVEFFQTNLKG
jgi:dipeptidyl-peptidase-4